MDCNCLCVGVCEGGGAGRYIIKSRVSRPPRRTSVFAQSRRRVECFTLFNSGARDTPQPLNVNESIYTCHYRLECVVHDANEA